MPKFSFLTKNLVQFGPQKCQKPQGRPEAMPNFSFLTKKLSAIWSLKMPKTSREAGGYAQFFIFD